MIREQIQLVANSVTVRTWKIANEGGGKNAERTGILRAVGLVDEQRRRASGNHDRGL